MQGWNVGDLISLAVGAVFCLVVSLLRKKARTRDGVVQNFATGTAMGPIALLLLSPFGPVAHALGWGELDLVKIVMSEARVTLVFSAFVAAVYLIDSALPGDGRR